MSNQKIDNPEKAKVFEGHFPHGSSVRALAHYAQIHNGKKFVKYNYGSAKKNQEAYGQDEPPLIDLQKIKEVPIAMFVGEQDNIVSVKDNRWLKTQLESMVHYQELPFDHLSFLLADDMSYFDTVLDTVLKYNPVPESISKKEKNRREVR